MNNLAHRVFHTPQAQLSTKAGEPSGVILGVLNNIKSTIERFPESTRVFAMWDGGKSAWRKEFYPAYKAQRDYGKDDAEKKEKYDTLWKQMEILHQNLHKFGVNSIKIDGQEADDLIASACHCLPGNKMIVTSDKDMLQLISPEVSVYSPHKGKVIGMVNFFEETKVTLDAYLGYRALVGDSSDNIFGVPGIGEKTAIGLMDKYGHIDNVLNAQGDDKKALMKSARTKKIYEQENLQILGRNNKIMSFKFAQYDILNPVVADAFVNELTVDSKNIKEFFIQWGFVQNLTNYVSWVMPFKGLGNEE